MGSKEVSTGSFNSSSGMPFSGKRGGESDRLELMRFKRARRRCVRKREGDGLYLSARKDRDLAGWLKAQLRKKRYTWDMVASVFSLSLKDLD